MMKYRVVVSTVMAIPSIVAAQIRVSPAVVNVGTQDATSVFLSYGGLRPDQRLADAIWCGRLVSAAPAIGSRCDQSTEWGQLPLRYDRATPSGAGGTGGFTDIMSIPASIARRAYTLVAGGGAPTFFYVRHVVSASGLPDEFVVVVCKLASGGASVPLSLTDVKVSAGGDQSVVFVSSRSAPAGISANIRYTGTGRLVGRWEVVRPGDELPTDDDLLTEATLPLELRAHQRRYTELERFNVFLPPSGRVSLPGPDPSKLPMDVDGTYLVLLRIEASADDADNSNLSAVGTGTGVVASGAVAGFPMPVLRYVVGAAPPDVSEKTTRGVRPLLPQAGDSIAPNIGTSFGWIEDVSAALYRLEIVRDDGEMVHSAIVARGLATYRGPPWLVERAAGHQLKWRVVALDDRGRPRSMTEWRALRVGGT